MNTKPLFILIAIIAISFASANAYVENVYPTPLSPQPVPIENSIAPAPIAPTPAPIEPTPIAISQPTNPAPIEGPIIISNPTNPVNPEPIGGSGGGSGGGAPAPRPVDPTPIAISQPTNPAPIERYTYFATPIRVAPVEPTPVITVSNPTTPAPIERDGSSGGGSSGGSSGGNGGGNNRRNNNDNDDDGKRNPLLLGNDNNQNLEELNTASESSENAWSKITGAVTGVFGKRGTLGIGIFIVVLGLAGLLVYNRERLGIVKKE